MSETFILVKVHPSHGKDIRFMSSFCIEEWSRDWRLQVTRFVEQKALGLLDG